MAADSLQISCRDSTNRWIGIGRDVVEANVAKRVTTPSYRWDHALAEACSIVPMTKSLPPPPFAEDVLPELTNTPG